MLATAMGTNKQGLLGCKASWRLPQVQLILVQLDAGPSARLDAQVPLAATCQRPGVHCRGAGSRQVGTGGRRRAGRAGACAARGLAARGTSLLKNVSRMAEFSTISATIAS